MGCCKALAESEKYTFAYYEFPLFSVKITHRKKVWKLYIQLKKFDPENIFREVGDRFKRKISVGQCFSVWSGLLARSGQKQSSYDFSAKEVILILKICVLKLSSITFIVRNYISDVTIATITDKP